MYPIKTFMPPAPFARLTFGLRASDRSPPPPPLRHLGNRAPLRAEPAPDYPGARRATHRPLPEPRPDYPGADTALRSCLKPDARMPAPDYVGAPTKHVTFEPWLRVIDRNGGAAKVFTRQYDGGLSPRQLKQR